MPARPRVGGQRCLRLLFDAVHHITLRLRARRAEAATHGGVSTVPHKSGNVLVLAPASQLTNTALELFDLLPQIGNWIRHALPPQTADCRSLALRRISEHNETRSMLLADLTTSRTRPRSSLILSMAATITSCSASETGRNPRSRTESLARL